MTKERLEELIKQGATIWSSGFNEELKLNPKNCKIEKQKWLTEPEPKLYLVVKEDEGHYPTYCLDNLREDVDHAKWEHDMYTERTERFEPPMWDDLQEDLEVIDYKFAFTTNGNCVYVFVVGSGVNNGSIELNKFSVYEPEMTCIYKVATTKENYEKACEIVRDLFKGEK